MSSLALGYVMSLLARREYSEFELRCKMQEKRFTEQEIAQTLAHCQQKNWQNDKRFAENYLYHRAKRGYGLQRIKQELHQLKGIQAELIDEIAQESEIDWCKIVLQVLNKNFLNIEINKIPKLNKKSGVICFLMALALMNSQITLVLGKMIISLTKKCYFLIPFAFFSIVLNDTLSPIFSFNIMKYRNKNAYK